MIKVYFSSVDGWKAEEEYSTTLEAAKAIEYQLGYGALIDATTYAVDSFGTSKATIEGATFEDLRKSLPISVSQNTQINIDTAMTSAKENNFQDAEAVLNMALKEATTGNDLTAVKKAILDIEALKPSGDWFADYWGKSASTSVMNSYKAGHVRTIKVID